MPRGFREASLAVQALELVALAYSGAHLGHHHPVLGTAKPGVAAWVWLCLLH